MLATGARQQCDSASSASLPYGVGTQELLGAKWCHGVSQSTFLRWHENGRNSRQRPMRISDIFYGLTTLHSSNSRDSNRPAHLPQVQTSEMLKDRDFWTHFSPHLWYQFHQHFAWYQQLLMLWPQVNHRIQKRPFIHCQNLSVKLCSEIFKEKTHKKMKGHFWKDDVHHIYLFHKIEAATPFHPKGWEVGIYCRFHQIIPKNPESKPANPGNKYSWSGNKPSVADCFRKCMGDKSATLKNQSKSQNPPHPRGSQTHRRRHISQPPMRVHQLFGLFGTPASSCGRDRRGGQRCRKKMKKTRLWDIQ